MLELTKYTSRQAEIIEVVLRRGWGYMRHLLNGSNTDEPELPPPTVLRNILTDLGPMYIKLGQLLSTRPDLLSADYITALSSLQSNVPPEDPAEMEIFIRQHLPAPPEELFSEISYTPVAAGSIAQTHKAILRDGRPVALKVQRPRIDTIVAQDTEIIKYIARLVSVTSVGQRYNLVDLADEFSRALQSELNFTKEAEYTDRLRTILSKSKWFDPSRLVVPQIYWELTSKKILVMEWLDGKPILTADFLGKDYDGDTMAERKAISTLLFRAFFQQYLIEGFFHADPHPGNVFYLNDGRVALLDCGMVGMMNPQTRTTLTEMFLAIVSSDAQRCAQLTLQLAEPMQPIDLLKLEGEYSRLLSRYYNLNLSEFNTAEAFSAILHAATRNHLRWPSNIGLFTKSLANLEGAARQFNPSINVLDEIRPLMTDLFRQQLLGDDPLLAVLRTAVEFRNLSLESPRQVGFLLDRLSMETMKFNVELPAVETLSRAVDSAANRRSFSTLVGSLVVGAAIASTQAQVPELQLVSEILFAAASFLGLWLIISILRSGNARF